MATGLLFAGLLSLSAGFPAAGQESPRSESEARGAESGEETAADSPPAPEEEAEEAPPSTDFRPTESVPPGSSVSFPVDI